VLILKKGLESHKQGSNDFFVDFFDQSGFQLGVLVVARVVLQRIREREEEAKKRGMADN
jgi:hypothetical protein